MKRIITLTLLAAFVIGIAACAGNKNTNGNNKNKTLVLYYSQTGTTKTVAQELGKKLGADLEELELLNPYGGTYDETIRRVQQERKDNILPKLKPLTADLAEYDTIFLGYPIWFGTYAPAVAALVKEQTFAGKKIVPFATFGSGGLEASAKDLTKALPNAEIKQGYGVRTARINAMPEEIDRFLKENKFIKGKVKTLPEYSAQQPVGKAEIAIFDEACGNYQFPLGTPISYGKRVLGNSTDYKFIAKTPSMTGEEVETVIYVLAENGKKAEFTKVVR